MHSNLPAQQSAAGQSPRVFTGRSYFAIGLFCASVLGLLIPGPAQADTEAEQLREELRQMRQESDQRIQKLEHRLQQVESTKTPTTNAVSAPTESPVTVITNALDVKRFTEEQFTRRTESRNQASRLSSPPFRARVEQVLQNFVDITGYFRAGYGSDNEGGPQVGFQAPGAFSKYRLGNEAETYGELTFGKNFYAGNLFSLDNTPRSDGTPTGPIARVQATMSIYNPYQELLSSSGTDIGLPEIWAAVGNVWEAQPSMKFWAGNRYYRRHDIHISDFFFYNMSGAGGGVEDIELPFGKLAMAWIGAASESGFSDLPTPDPNNKAGFSKSNWDLRLYDVPLPLGKGEFGLVYATADSGLDSNGVSAEDSEGVAFTFLHTREEFLSEDGVNKFSVQYGTGAAKTFTAGFEQITLTNGTFIQPDARDSWRFRVTESFIANLNDHFSLSPALVYQLTDNGDRGGRVEWFSAGLRPIVHFNEYFSLAFEGGMDWVRDDTASTDGNLYKFTIAPQVSLGGRFMSRPVLRVFATYAHWSDDFVGRVGGNDYLNENEGMTYGVQMEVWW